jgi:hypothetical protein
MSDASLRPIGIHVLAGTGSRDLQTAPVAEKRAAAARVEAELAARVAQHGEALVVMSGMAEGFDKLLALSALRAGIRLWCAIPNKGYGNYYWSAKESRTGKDQRAEFDRIVAAAWKATYVMEDIHHTHGIKLNGVHSNFLRNDFMVEQADEFLVWDPQSRGTKQCFATIRKVDKPYVVLTLEDPEA